LWVGGAPKHPTQHSRSTDSGKRWPTCKGFIDELSRCPALARTFSDWGTKWRPGVYTVNPPTLWLSWRWSRGSALEPQGQRALPSSVQTDTIPVRAGRIRLISPPGHPPASPLALIPCRRWETNLFCAPHRHLLLLPHTRKIIRVEMNSFQTCASKGWAISHGKLLPFDSFHFASPPVESHGKHPLSATGGRTVINRPRLVAVIST
jgi:hypothetical protein